MATNQIAIQSTPIFISEIISSIFASIDKDFSFDIYNYPFRMTEGMRNLDNSDDFLLPSIVFSMGFSFIPTVIFCLYQKSVKKALNFNTQQVDYLYFYTGLAIFSGIHANI